ncbi:unnamed protein product, partial [Phaeothamnion confervicola]
QYCTGPLQRLENMEFAFVFKEPVDPVKLGLPDYFDIVKKPMDLGTIRRYLDSGRYHTLEDFEGDVNLVFDNAILYNGKKTEVGEVADNMKKVFAGEWAAMKRVVQQVR